MCVVMCRQVVYVSTGSRKIGSLCVVCRCVRKIVSLCVSVCRHVSSGCFFVSIYVDMCRQSFCVSAVGHPKNIQKVKVRKSLKKGCNVDIQTVSSIHSFWELPTWIDSFFIWEKGSLKKKRKKKEKKKKRKEKKRKEKERIENCLNGG